MKKSAANVLRVVCPCVFVGPCVALCELFRAGAGKDKTSAAGIPAALGAVS